MSENQRPEFKKWKSEQLAKYLRDEFGIPAEELKGEKRMALYSRAVREFKARGIATAGSPEKTGEEEAPDLEVGKPRSKPGPKLHVERRMRVRIHPEKGELPFIFLSVNGHALQIPREKEVNIPLQHFEALERAITTITDKTADGMETQKDVPRFNYTVLGEVLTDKHGNPVESASAA